jgi:Ca2+-binding EF-hand superfamily protein
MAEEAFQENDINHDGVLSLYEFKKWYQGNFLFQEATSDRASSDRVSLTHKNDDHYQQQPEQHDSAGTPYSLEEIREATNLKSISTGDLLELIGSRSDKYGRLTRAAFKEAFTPILHGVSDAQKADAILSRMFDIFDTARDGYVNLSELSCGLSVLCGGAFEEKVETAFQMYDMNGDGFISMDEMVRYLTSVFTVVFETRPGMQAEMGVTPAELGRETAEHAFETADLNHDGRISYDEFKSWYLTTDMDGTAHADESIPEWFVLSQVREVCNLSSRTAEEAFEAFAQETDDVGCLNLSQFKRAFVHLGVGASGERSDSLELILNRLFSLFDKGQTGRVDYQELVSGLSVLCGGNREDKIRAAFALFDYNGDGFISKDEMTRYLVAVFKVLYATQSGIEDQMGVSSEELGRITAEQAFRDSDLDHDGRLSWSEFKAWYGLGLGDDEDDEDDADDPDYDPADDEDESDDDDDDLDEEGNLDDDDFEARVFEETTLPEQHIVEIFEAFAERADMDGQLQYEDFVSCFQGQFLKSVESEVPYEFFAVAENNGFEAVDYCEMMVMLSVFAGGSDEEKAQAVFTLFDYQNQGHINLEEMAQMLVYLFRILFHGFPWAYQVFFCCYRSYRTDIS